MKKLTFKSIYSIIIVILYFVFGIILLYQNLIQQDVPNKGLAAFGGAVFLYGIYRAFRLYNDVQNSKEEENDIE